MVSWGTNTVHNFGQQAPTPGGGFGTPAPAPSGGLFGSTPAPATGGLFGSTPAPAPSGGGLFGSTPAPAPSGGGLFGSTGTPAPAPSGGLFGSTPAPAPSGGLFGSTPAPAPSGGFFGSTPAPAGGSLFGSSAPAPSTSLFGTPAAAAQPQIPAQAALQAHMDASARQEAERLRVAMEKLYTAYSSGEKFVSIVYSDLTPEQRQLQWLHGMGFSDAILLAPPRDPRVSEERWDRAVAENPDPKNYTPTALIGAEALRARVAWQQSRSDALSKNIETLQATHKTLSDRRAKVAERLEQLQRQYDVLRKTLMSTMMRVEVIRCANQPLQPDEGAAQQKLQQLQGQVDACKALLTKLHDHAAMLNVQTETSQTKNVVDMPDEEKLLAILNDHRTKLESWTGAMHKDMSDAKLIQQRLAAIASGAAN